MTTTIFDLDTQRNQLFYDSGYSGYTGTPSPVSSISSGMVGSPASQGSDLAYETSNLSVYQQTYYDMDNRTSNMNALNVTESASNDVQLVIMEEPVEKFRFRYKSEMHGTHGSLMGCRTEKSRKTYPTVELRGYKGEAVILCSLYQTDEALNLQRMPHSHRLVVRNGDVEVCDPHELYVSPKDGYRAVFQGMGIIHTAKKYIVDELKVKLKREKLNETGAVLSPREEMQIKTNAERIAKTMNLNQVCLGFQAFTVHSDRTLTRLCAPVFSRPINNMKSALTGELKITRLSAAVSSAAGGDDLFLFVEKVGKKNIKVRFFEVDENDELVWEALGVFSEADVHHQYAIALRTPPYKDKDIDHHKDVFIELVRPSDNDRSEPMPFKYKPRDVVTSRKRARMSSSTCSSNELPESITSRYNNPMSNASNAGTISNEYDKDEFLNHFLNHVYKDKSGELENIINDVGELIGEPMLQMDGASSKPARNIKQEQQRPSVVVRRTEVVPSKPTQTPPHINQIYSIYRQNGEKNIDVARENILTVFDEATSNDCDIIQTAIRNDDPNNMVKLLKLIDKLQLNEVLRYQNERKETCLHIACLFDRPEYIRPLINLGADPNLADCRGNTPLHIAIEESMDMCANRIIDPKNYTEKSVALHIDCANDDGLTPLHLAVMKKSLNMVRGLLKSNASTKLYVSKNGNNALHLAIEQNCLEIVQYLLEKTSINVNEPNLAGFTPLRLANSMDNISSDVVRLLLKCGAHEGEAKLSLNKLKREVSSTNKMELDETSSDEEDDEYEKPLTIDEKYQSDDESDASTKPTVATYTRRTSNSTSTSIALFDKDSILRLSKDFNNDDKWKKLAHELKLDRQIAFWGSQKNPTLLMFNCINNLPKDRQAKLKDVINALYAIGELESIKRIHEIEGRNVSS